VSRSNLREAIQKLEFYGLLKSKPQSGTFVADIGQVAMKGMMDDILALGNPDFRSLVETRILLELKIVELAALRRTEEDLTEIKNALEAYSAKIMAGTSYVQEDLLFHLAIARASKNSTLTTLMLLITPEIIGSYHQDRVCKGDEALYEIKKHKDIFLAIRDKKPKLAKEKMDIHFTRLNEYVLNYKETK
jgi:GntR family transcriptional repressor for pyruvate dehydrogenase complex